MHEAAVSGSALLAAAAKAVELYALKHPRPLHVTQQQAAVMLGLHRHTIGKFVDSGKLRINRCGLIPIDQIDALLIVD